MKKVLFDFENYKVQRSLVFKSSQSKPLCSVVTTTQIWIAQLGIDTHAAICHRQ